MEEGKEEVSEEKFFKYLFRLYVKGFSEELSKLKGDDAKLKFLEEEMKENERYREFAIQELMQAERIRKFLRGQMKKVKKHVENRQNTAEGI